MCVFINAKFNQTILNVSSQTATAHGQPETLVGSCSPLTHRLSVNGLRWLPIAIQATVHVGGVLAVEPEDKRDTDGGG